MVQAHTYQMTKRFFDAHGKLMFGSHKGKHHSKAPEPWIEWACGSITGFEGQLAAAKAIKTPQKTGRRYVLDYTKKYERPIRQ
jgi:hypothetical protein